MKSFLSSVFVGLSATALLTFSPFTKAQWYESTGHALVQNGDMSAAKSAAIKDAITQALVFSGARVSSVQTLVDGVLMQDQLKISSHGEIQKIELISENKYDDKFAITLRLDIFAQTEQCPQNSFNKFLAVTQSQLNHREQAKMGQIFDIDKAVSKNIFSALQKSKMSAIPVAYYKNAIKVDKYFTQQHDYSTAQLEEIATRSNAQYVLLSQITNLSTSNKLNSEYAFWQDESYQRSYQIELTLFDGTTYEQLWQNSYQSQAIWPFEKTAIIDVNSDRFWQSPFGQSISEINHSLSYDIQATMACLPTQGKIMHIENSKIVINLGKAHGLQKGQLLSIAHHNYLTDAAGNVMPHKVTTLNTIRVEQLYQQTAVAVSIDDKPLPGVQINDVVEIISQDL
ncbi:flagellar biosynthesis protein FlgT [Pseudoalteromonas fuliginea]|uniref:Flagellar biosynthesis protein FlgT n=1 Tax=Pseudoalteromonas fuliginea TaxID=1872678 RepID=A0AB73BH94_9GAMM|nr:flagellar assembly protein FlgT [Pseudoalteromonas fuliginea]KAA1160192.1 flagellar biosynthesis protein FlgT [Pseudoalteromonas fuliginea]